MRRSDHALVAVLIGGAIVLLVNAWMVVHGDGPLFWQPPQAR